MSALSWKNFQVPVIAGVIIDKLVLSKDDSWALASILSSRNDHPIWMAFLWTLPQIGSSQFMARGFPMGHTGAYGVIVGDGQQVHSLNPITLEWLFGHHSIPCGSCFFASVSHRDGPIEFKSKFPRYIGIVATVAALCYLCMTVSIPRFSALFLGAIYFATLISNIHLALQSQHVWAGYVKDTENARMLILVQGDRWAVLNGPRGLIKMITTGTHVDQFPTWLQKMGPPMIVMVILSAGFLQSASMKDGAHIAFVFVFLHLVAQFKANRLHKKAIIRGVSVNEDHTKTYNRRAELVAELSDFETSDAWAYESGLLTRAYVPPNKERQAKGWSREDAV